MSQLKLGNIQVIFLNFQNCTDSEKYLKYNKHNSPLFCKNMFGYLSLDIIRFSKITNSFLSEIIFKLAYFCAKWRLLHFYIIYGILIAIPPYSSQTQRVIRTKCLPEKIHWPSSLSYVQASLLHLPPLTSMYCPTSAPTIYPLTRMAP